MVICTIPKLTKHQRLYLMEICDDEIYFVEGLNALTIPYEQVKIIITFGYDIHENILNKMESLQWIHIFQTGIEHLPLNKILKYNIKLTHTKNVHGIPISEYVLSMILYSVRDIPRFIASKSAKYWDDGAELQVGEAYGKTVAIFGTGSIGSEIAKVLKSMHMTVLGVNTTGKSKRFFDKVYSMDNKYTVLEKSDFVVLVLPSTKETYHCIGEKELKKMKENSFLINVGRGSLIDTTAITKSLAEGKIKGAALDVFEHEPLPEDSPLWDLKNLFITPHIATLTNRYYDRCINLFNINFKLFTESKNLQYQIK